MINVDLYPSKEFNTERLQLKVLQHFDALDFHAIRSNPLVMKYIERPRTNSIVDAEAMIQKMEEYSMTGAGITWGIFLKEGRRLIGTIGLYRIDKENHRTEIGYLLHPDFWKQGLMSEAIQCCLEYCFNSLNFHAITACINPNNENSRNILIKHNFVKEAYFKESLFFEGKFYDSEFFTLFKG